MNVQSLKRVNNSNIVSNEEKIRINTQKIITCINDVSSGEKTISEALLAINGRTTSQNLSHLNNLECHALFIIYHMKTGQYPENTSKLRIFFDTYASSLWIQPDIFAEVNNVFTQFINDAPNINCAINLQQVANFITTLPSNYNKIEMQAIYNNTLNEIHNINFNMEPDDIMAQYIGIIHEQKNNLSLEMLNDLQIEALTSIYSKFHKDKESKVITKLINVSVAQGLIKAKNDQLLRLVNKVVYNFSNLLKYNSNLNIDSFKLLLSIIPRDSNGLNTLFEIIFELSKGSPSNVYNISSILQYETSYNLRFILSKLIGVPCVNRRFF